jgi:hypothetical protein
MRIIEAKQQLHLQGRAVSPRGWLAWGALFIPGLLALQLIPEAYRFIGLLVWIGLWLALIAVVPRALGVLIQVTVDRSTRQIVWQRDSQVTRTLPFSQVKQLEVAQLATASRPYKTYQLFAALKDGTRVTLAVDPGETEIRRALQLARERMK